MSYISERARSLEPGRLVELYEIDLSPQGSTDPPLYFHPYVNLGEVQIQLTVVNRAQTVLISAPETARWQLADVGRYVTGQYIPAGATVQSVSSGTNASLSTNVGVVVPNVTLINGDVRISLPLTSTYKFTDQDVGRVIGGIGIPGGASIASIQGDFNARMSLTASAGGLTTATIGVTGVIPVSLWRDPTIRFRGNVYQPVSIRSEGWDKNTEGVLPRPKVVVGNIDEMLTGLMRIYGDLVACAVTRHRTYTQYLDDGAEPGPVGTFTAAVTGIFTTPAAHNSSIGDKLRFNSTGTLPAPLKAGVDYYIISANFTTTTFKVSLAPAGAAVVISDIGAGFHSFANVTSPALFQEYPTDRYSVERKTQETPVFVEFELTSSFDVETASLPRRQILTSFCPWVYRGPECSYTSYPVADSDSKAIDVAHLAGTISTQNGIALITATTSIFTVGKTGGLITGNGIPYGTTILTVADTTHATLSNNATATASGVAVKVYSTLYSASVSYRVGDWVYVGIPVTGQPSIPGGDVQHYRCLTAGSGFAVSDPTKFFHTGQLYDATRTYVLGDYIYVMVAGIRVYYASLADGNLNNPLTDKTKWVRDECTKQVSACKARFGLLNPLPFGGFPGAGSIPSGA